MAGGVQCSQFQSVFVVFVYVCVCWFFCLFVFVFWQAQPFLICLCSKKKNASEKTCFVPLFMGKQGRNSSVSSVLGSLSCVMQRCGFNPPLSLQEREIFPRTLELMWVLTPFPKNSFD